MSDRWLVFEDGEGWLVVDPRTEKVTRCTLEINQATAMRIEEAKRMLNDKARTRPRFLFPLWHERSP